MSLTSKYSSTLCLIVHSCTTGSPDEKALFTPIKDYLYLKGFASIEVRSPGEALIQSRQAKFFFIIAPDDDHNLIRKIKCDDGPNTDTIVIAISSEENIKDTTKQLLDQNIIQHVISKTNDQPFFLRALLEIINAYLPTDRPANDCYEEGKNAFHFEKACSELIQTSQPNHTYSTPFPSPLPMPQSHLSFTMANQLGPMYFSANQAPLTDSQSQQSLSNQSYPLQPFALIPPMVVPFHALMQANSSNLNPNDENYMMPRIVDFGALQGKMAAQVQQGFLPAFYNDCATIDAAALDKGELHKLDKDLTEGDEISNHALMQEVKGELDVTCNDVLPVDEASSVSVSVDDENGALQNKLPSFEKFLECLQPQSANKSNQDINTRQEERPPPAKRLCMESHGVECRRIRVEPPTLQDGDDEAKNPFSTLQSRPYFVFLDEQMEDIAFNPKVKSSDRHNAKERHRRIRITKAAEFFKENIPCMNPTMDKATALHITVYYMLFLRNALRQIDPNIIEKLHESYKDEWKAYFEKVTVPATEAAE